MSILEKQWGPTIKHAAIKGKTKFRIIMSSWHLTSELDDYDQGEIGGGGSSETSGKGGDFPDLKSAIAFLSRYGAPSDPKQWYAFSGENGRLECSWSGDVDGSPLSRNEEAAWKAGNFEAYNWTMTAYIQFARVYTPGSREMSKVLGIRED